jgi:hypothetical protein
VTQQRPSAGSRRVDVARTDGVDEFRDRSQIHPAREIDV